MTNLQKQRIAELHGQGIGYARIAESFGISENTVKSFCRRGDFGFVFVAEKVQPTTDACENCGKPTTKTTGAKKKHFCSDKCRLAWWVVHPEAVNRKAVYKLFLPVLRGVVHRLR
jgi:hypothetical protein